MEVPPFLSDFMHALEASAPAAFFRNSAYAYASLAALHVFSVALVVGPLATLDLRLLGLFRAFPVSALAPPLTRAAAIGLYFAILSGFLLFSVRALEYATNLAFLAMIVLVLMALFDAILLRSTLAWRDTLDEDDEPIPDTVRAAALRSLLIWAGAVVAGRWIAVLQ